MNKAQRSRCHQLLVYSVKWHIAISIMMFAPPRSLSQTTVPESSVDVIAMAKAEMDRTAVLWTPVMNASLYGIYKLGKDVAIYGGAYVLLESPTLAADLLAGGIWKLGTSLAKDVTLTVVENAVMTPRVACKSISKSLLEEGWQCYQVAYTIVQKSKHGKPLSRQEAVTFLKNRWGPDILALGRELYNDSQLENYSIDRKVGKKAVADLFLFFDMHYQQYLGIDRTLPLTKTALFIKDVADILRAKNLGLMAYGPYLRFLAKMEAIQRARSEEMHKYSNSRPCTLADAKQIWRIQGNELTWDEIVGEPQLTIDLNDDGVDEQVFVAVWGPGGHGLCEILIMSGETPCRELFEFRGRQCGVTQGWKFVKLESTYQGYHDIELENGVVATYDGRKYIFH